ncbi:TniB family NTP-binding protein [Paenibacillus qinlingensis]|uniref:TniB family NTP-binding protein n=1 Tax=Paenibacillus qinlingensis TaxID=1837343 RepID=UPI0015661DCE|nr:TniB family NTP-binding protein [Paenibacillus qinlingensis]NQX62211.1 TniB family NTP-binding protein [Paenibacillus qinlingensis]
MTNKLIDEKLEHFDEVDTFAKRVAALHIVHPKVQKIREALNSIRRLNQYRGGSNSPRHRFVIGLSGVGKTQMMRRYADQCGNYVDVNKDGDEIEIRPVVYVNLPDPFTIMELYRSIIHGLRAPQLNSRASIGDVKQQVFTLLEVQKVEMLILDEMDHILNTRYVTDDEAMGAIKHITNHGQVSVICVGTPEIERLRKLDSQHFRRYPPTKLERFLNCDDNFYDLLALIEEQLAPPTPIGFQMRKARLLEDDSIKENQKSDDSEAKLIKSAEKIANTLHRSTFGLVGYLTPILQEAYSLLGVFEAYFDEDTADLNLRRVLKQAYQNIVGDVSEEELNKMITS